MAQQQAGQARYQYEDGAEDHPGGVPAVRDGHRNLRFGRLRRGHEEEEEEGASEHGTIRQYQVPDGLCCGGKDFDKLDGRVIFGVAEEL
ncbi:hypothetical protein TomMM35A_12520 [Sphingobium sp. TomMM35A]